MMANTNTTTNVVAIGVPSPATPVAQNHRFYQHLSPFTSTPSPYAASTAAAATGSLCSWSPRILSLLLRALAFLLSFASAIALAVPRPQAAPREPGVDRRTSVSILHYTEFSYCLTAAIISAVYLSFQLCKGIWDIAFKGSIVPERISDYITFFFDQAVAYLLISSSSVSVLAAEKVASTKLRAAAIASTVFSFGAFLAMASSALLAGYRLCKRLIW